MTYNIRHENPIQLARPEFDPLSFHTIDEVQNWLSTQNMTWAPIIQARFEEPLTSWRQQFTAPLDKLSNAIAQYRNMAQNQPEGSTNSGALGGAWGNVGAALSEFATRPWMVSPSPKFNELTELLKHDVYGTLIRIGIAHLGQPVTVQLNNRAQVDLKILVPALLDLYLDDGLKRDYTLHQEKTLEFALNSFHERTVKLKAEQDALLDELQSKIAIATSDYRGSSEALSNLRSESQKRRLKLERMVVDAIHKGQNDYQTLRNLYETQMKLQSSVTYWTDRAKATRRMANLSLIAFILVAALFLTTLLVWRNPVLNFISDKDGKLQLGAAFLVTLISVIPIWLLRMIARPYAIGISEQIDASQRAVMTTAFLALSKDASVPLSDSERIIILQALFRSGSGSADEDQPPTSLLELLAKTLQGNNAKF